MPPASDRTPTCPHFGRCGGCSALDVPIQHQLERKLASLRHAVGAWLGAVEPECPLPPRPPRHDRAQMLYPVQPHPREGLVMGIYRTGTHVVEPIRDCRIQMKALTTWGDLVQQSCRELAVPPYDEATGRGQLRAIRARVVPGSRELLVGMIATRAAFGQRDALASAMWEAGDALKDEQGRRLPLVGVVLNVNDQRGNVLLGPSTTALLGRDHQIDIVGKLRFRVSFASFYQQNRHADAILYRPALAMLGDVGGLTVVDGYGGVGTFGLRLRAAGASRVTIVESAPSSVADARHNVAANDLGAVDVVAAPFEQAEFATPDVLVVDPPRSGLQQPGAARVLATGAARVLLVSCALPSLARDLALLDAGYRVVAMRLCDLFPHTEHMEILTMLERRGPA